MSATPAAEGVINLRGTFTSQRRLRAIAGGAAGNFIEWFDWFLFVSFALYFAPVFFPANDRSVQLMQSAAVLAIGFVMRPLGALVMGRIADRHGRKTALTISVGLMCTGSLVIALTPGYATIGLAAPALLLLARVGQGFSVGGEYGVSATYISEMAGDRRRGFWSSFQCVTLVLGQLAALCFLLLLQSLLSEEALRDWGWRLAFLVGAVMAVGVFLLRRGLEETDSFSDEKIVTEKRGSVLVMLREHPKVTLMVAALTAAGSTGFYVFIGFSQKFLVVNGNFNAAQATQITALALVVFLFVQPLFGLLSDHVGRRTCLALSFGLCMLASVPVMTALAQTASVTGAWILLSLLLVCFSGYSALGAVVKAELFPTHIRALGVGLPYAVANAIFGGTAEFIGLYAQSAGLDMAFYLYIASAMGLGLIVSLLLPETGKRNLLH